MVSLVSNLLTYNMIKLDGHADPQVLQIMQQRSELTDDEFVPKTTILMLYCVFMKKFIGVSIQ